MKNDLIERYIYAVTKGLPRKLRSDVSQELQGLIEDMLTERCQGRIAEEKDVRIVLTELGSPQELAQKYDADAQKCLIGPPYYAPYKLVLKIVLSAAAVGLTIANIILLFLEPQPWYTAAGQWLAMLWQGLMSSFAFVTLLFAVFYRKGIRIGEPFNFDNLPPVPKKRQEIPIWEPVAGICFSILFLIIFLVIPQIFTAVSPENGTFVPVFLAEVIRAYWYILILFSLVGIIREIVKLMERRYNRRVLITTVIVNLISALLAFWWLSGNAILNPDFVNLVLPQLEPDAAFVGTIFSNFQYFFLGVMLFALTLDTIDAFVKSRD